MPYVPPEQCVQFRQHVDWIDIETITVSAHKDNLWQRQNYLLTMHGPDTLKALEIPQFDSHVCRAGG